MSKERDVIFDMIEEREQQVRVKHRAIDALYDKYDWQAKYAGVDTLHEEITRLYAEVLLLKMVLMRAEEPLEPLTPLLEEEFSDEGRG